ncbi:sensor domain-containing diguanylate cyclase [Pleionea sediminis]|uniref:sensor domain-containing diguanylate cyclase n=1 Tax=Pleionea sediminis TaxID=2569479 RepID=UPI001186C7FC|nr:sensor domain-containing diguanylate cyclase [Pleionea sediminis]
MAIIHQANSQLGSLEQENERLKSLLESLVSKAEKNTSIQKKFHRLEFDLLNTASLPLLFHQLANDFKQRLDVEAASVFVYDPYGESQNLLREIYPEAQLDEVTFTKELHDIEELYPKGFITQLYKKNYLLARRLFTNGNQIKSLIMLPLIRNGVLLGSYQLGSENPDRFSPEMSTDFYQHFCQVVAVCLENTINSDKLKHLSLTDPLTKTKNRRCLYQALNKEISRAERELSPLSCLFIDIDHFKQINDNFGHSTGDYTLEYVAKAIIPNLRATDLLARYGGEEFAIILPNSDENIALSIAERIRVMIARQTLSSTRGKPFHITCSIGCTTWHPQVTQGSNQEICDALIFNADKAVYWVKENGRNACKELPFSLNQ